MIISGRSYRPEALNIRLQCLVPLNKMVELNASIVPSWKKQRPFTKLLVFHLPSGKMRWKQLCTFIIANLCVVLTGHLLYLNGMARHLMCHILRFLDVWHTYVFIPKEDRQNKLSAKAEEATFIGYEKGTDSGLLSADG